MPDDKLTQSRPVEDVKATVFSTGDASKLTSGMIATTEGSHQPNLVVTVISPFKAVIVRFLYAFFTQLGTLVGAAMTTNVIPASDFWHLVLKCAALSVAGAGLIALKDIAKIFGQLQDKYPLLEGL